MCNYDNMQCTLIKLMNNFANSNSFFKANSTSLEPLNVTTS